MNGRIPLDHLTSDQYDELCDQLDALRQVARGYCPECGRGDASPTTAQWYAERQRADHAEGQLRHLQATSEAAGILLTRTTDERDQLRAAIARVRALAARIRQGAPWTANHDDLADRILAALEPVGPATTQTTEPAWTPPPPGDRREQLPDHLLDLIRGSIPDYTSTACVTAYTLAVAVHWSHPQRAELGQWAERMHQRCRINQKFTGQICQCFCHEAADGHASGGPDA